MFSGFNMDDRFFSINPFRPFRIRFRHPRKGNLLEIEAPLPAEFQRTLAALRQHRRT